MLSAKLPPEDAMNFRFPRAALMLLLLAATHVQSHGIVRREGPGFPIATSVVVPAGTELGKIETELAAAGFTMGDIVKMEIYVVADPEKGGVVDIMGLSAAYLAYFDREKGGLPARTTVQVAGLPTPGALVQIAVTAARAGHRHE